MQTPLKIKNKIYFQNAKVAFGTKLFVNNEIMVLRAKAMLYPCESFYLLTRKAKFGHLRFVVEIMTEQSH